jgi:hypothetical protein
MCGVKYFYKHRKLRPMQGSLNTRRKLLKMSVTTEVNMRKAYSCILTRNTIQAIKKPEDAEYNM